MTLSIIVGNVGSGKTLLATILASFYSGEVKANYELHLAQASEFQLTQFLGDEYSNCMIILDEAYIYLESRISGNALNRALSYLLFQSRKTGLEIVLTAQLFSTLDVRFRTLADVVVEAQAFSTYFEYNAYARGHRSTGGFDIQRVFRLPINKAEQFFPLYNTMEKINPIADLEVVRRQITPAEEKREQARQYLQEIVDFFNLEDGQSPTHAQVEYYSELNDIPKFLHKMIYLEGKIRG